MSESPEWEEAVARLAQQTAAGEIKWNSVPNLKGQCTAGDSVIGVPYFAEVLGKRFLVYEYQYQYYEDENRWSPANDVAIDFVDKQFNMEFRVPDVPSRWVLLAGIREHTSGAKDFLQALLGKKKTG